MIGEIIDNIADAADALGLYATIVYGSDPPENGICMIQAAGAPTEKHFDTGMLYGLSVLLNGKHSDQQTLLDALTQIHTALTKRNDFSDFSTTDAQVLSIMTTSSPQIIGREQNNQWIAGSSFEVSFYWR